MSVATWSLRLRAVWSFAAAGTLEVSACSMFMCTSSRRSSQWNRPEAMSARMASRPSWIALHSFLVSRPTWASISLCALLQATSYGASRLSRDADSLNLSISAAGPASKRPPQVACVCLAMIDGI